MVCCASIELWMCIHYLMDLLTNSWVTKRVEACVWDAIAEHAWIVWLDEKLFSKWKCGAQEKCLSSLTVACQAVPKKKKDRSKGPLQHFKIPRCKTNIDIILFNFLQTHSKFTDIYFNGFIESSVYIHEILFYGARWWR